MYENSVRYQNVLFLITLYVTLSGVEGCAETEKCFDSAQHDSLLLCVTLQDT